MQPRGPNSARATAAAAAATVAFPAVATNGGGAGGGRPGCEHCPPLTGDAVKQGDIRLLVRFALAANAPTRKTPGFPVPRCTTCQSPSARIAACLHCAYFGCALAPGHLHRHLRDRGHMLALDVAHCELYCHMCRDYVYDADFDSIVHEERRRLYEDIVSSRGVPASLGTAKRARTSAAAATLHAWSLPPSSPLWQVHRCSGLRGFYNLGSTCFMNCILQTIVHNPLMRAHYLADQHSPRTCTPPPESSCLACELTSLIGECFSGQAVPFNPHRFLYAMWKHASDLAGYEQQDAHEFFISLLDGLHLAEARRAPETQPGATDACGCIVHRVFCGVLRSDVVCLSCRNVSTSLEPFLDISLDLVHASDASGAAASPDSLVACLHRFTKAERLRATCDRCQASESTKQFSVRTLPPVLAIHLKRFEHRTAATVKVDGHITFPLELNMTAFLSSVAGAASSRAGTIAGGKGPCSPPGWTATVGQEYVLFAVINHVGTLESGHYVTYVRDHGDWYKIDDDRIVCAAVQEVINTDAYMLYYVKKHLDYAPS